MTGMEKCYTCKNVATKKCPPESECYVHDKRPRYEPKVNKASWLRKLMCDHEYVQRHVFKSDHNIHQLYQCQKCGKTKWGVW